MATVREIIGSTDLPSLDSAGRLRLVADLVEQNPDRWDQGTWGPDPDPDEASDGWYMNRNKLIHSCDTTACVGGWAEALFADPQVKAGLTASSEAVDSFEACRLYGFTAALGETIFYGTAFTDKPEWLPELMRRLADLPEVRTRKACLEIADQMVVEGLMAQGDREQLTGAGCRENDDLLVEELWPIAARELNERFARRGRSWQVDETPPNQRGKP